MRRSSKTVVAAGCLSQGVYNDVLEPGPFTRGCSKKNAGRNYVGGEDTENWIWIPEIWIFGPAGLRALKLGNSEKERYRERETKRGITVEKKCGDMRDWGGKGRLADPEIWIFGAAGLRGLKLGSFKEERPEERKTERERERQGAQSEVR